MKSERLIGLATPNSIDLIAAARTRTELARTPKITITITKRGITSTRLLPPPRYRARGIPDRSVLRPMWTIAELGQAAMGIPAIPFMAACYAFAGDRSNYWTLHAELHRRAVRLAHQNDWPHRVTDVHGIKVPYLEHLAALLLDWDANPAPFKQSPSLFAIYMRVSDNTWDKHLQTRWFELEIVWLSWLRTAAGMMQARLADDGRRADLEAYHDWSETES